MIGGPFDPRIDPLMEGLPEMSPQDLKWVLWINGVLAICCAIGSYFLG